MDLTEQHRQELFSAMQLLENPGITAKITNFVGTPIEKGIAMLPESWNDKIGVAVSGGVGGFFGLGALVIELPVSTTIMLRSIADIARAEGESINDPETKLACLEVFALGGKSKYDNATESGYFVVRTALAKSVAEAAEFIATRTLAEEGSPALLRFIVKIAERFSIQVTEKMAAQTIPAIGAAGGILVNTIFIDHFQDMAKGHFTIRRLEKLYGKERIKTTYEKMIKIELGY